MPLVEYWRFVDASLQRHRRWRLLPNSFEPRLPVHETTLCQWPTTTVRHIANDRIYTIVDIATYNVTRHNLHVIITYYKKYRVVNIDSRKHFWKFTIC